MFLKREILSADNKLKYKIYGVVSAATLTLNNKQESINSWLSRSVPILAIFKPFSWLTHSNASFTDVYSTVNTDITGEKSTGVIK